MLWLLLLLPSFPSFFFVYSFYFIVFVLFEILLFLYLQLAMSTFTIYIFWMRCFFCHFMNSRKSFDDSTKKNVFRSASKGLFEGSLTGHRSTLVEVREFCVQAPTDPVAVSGALVNLSGFRHWWWGSYLYLETQPCFLRLFFEGLGSQDSSRTGPKKSLNHQAQARKKWKRTFGI